MNRSKILTMLVAVSALVLTSAVTPAAARWGGGWHGGWRGAGIGAGIGAGLALGAAAANHSYGYGYPSYYGAYGYGGGYGYPRPESAPRHCCACPASRVGAGRRRRDDSQTTLFPTPQAQGEAIGSSHIGCNLVPHRLPLLQGAT
jgi:hypothetical protein